MQEQHCSSSDYDMERIKLKRILDDLDCVEGNATSMITLAIPRGGSLALMKKKLEGEFSTSTSIKSRV
jgi:peptide subunit release factor 1 (eRF1)